MVDEEIGEDFDVKRKLTLLWRRRSCRSNCDCFDGVTPRTLSTSKVPASRQIKITAINRTAVLKLGALEIFGTSRLASSPPIIPMNIADAERPVRITTGAARDCFHDAIAQPRVQFPEQLKIGSAEKNRVSNHNRNWHKPKPAAAARQRFASTENPHRHDRRERFGYDQTQSGLGRLKVAIERARAFRKNQDAVVRL